MNATTILEDLRAVASEEKRAVLACFFKSGPGEYGEGDQFLGVMVPQIRAVAKNHAGASAATEDALLASPWHEARECGLFLMCYGNLIVQNYPNLQSIIVKKNSLKNLNSLKICNCEKLKTVEIEDSTLYNVNNVIIESI